MNAVTAQVSEFQSALNIRAKGFDVQLNEAALRRLSAYYELLLGWNAQLHLVAPCSPAEFAVRHVLESLLLLPHLATNATVTDVGSGAGLPIIPALIVRPDVHATLVEASKKKAVFLREALRVTETSAEAVVLAERFENVPAPGADYLTCRALDRFTEIFPLLIRWSPPDSTLLLFGGDRLREQIEVADLKYSAVPVPDSERRFLFVCRQRSGGG